MALYLRDIAPVGEGLTGRGMEHPPPLSRRVTEDVFPCEQSINPRLPAATAPPPAPSRGRAVNGDWLGGRVRGSRNFGEFLA